MKDIPILNKTYNCFDDGKISESRRYEVIITEIIPFDKAEDELLAMWEEQGKPCDWLFGETDYFVRFKSTENEEEPNGVFARTIDGGWFGLGNWWNSGRLDIDGSLMHKLMEK
jgi:hypothetical protein